MFVSQIHDDDNDSTTYYAHDVVTARPLPVGTYRFKFDEYLSRYQPCEFHPDGYHFVFIIEAVAPEGTIHEAFFDPATTTAGVGYSAADAASGVLKPAEFSVGGRAATITGLTWREGKVVLSLSPFVPLGDHQLQFIVLDGSTSLALRASDATADRVAGTLTWTAADRPWSAGDQLVLRIGP